MKRRTLLLISMLVAPACGPLVTEPMPDIPETVEYDTVRIEYGDDDLLNGTSGTRQQMLVGDASGIAQVSQVFVKGTNLVIRTQIRLVEAVVRNDPTSYSDGVWVWDNTTFKSAEDRFSRFTIQRIEDGDFRYLWEVGNTADEMLEVFAGEFHPRARFDGRQRGLGLLRFNFTNMHEVDPTSTPEKGRVAIAFRSIGGVRQVRVATFDLVEAGETEPRSARYEYVQLPDDAGRFKFVAETDFLKDGAPFEELAIDAVWSQTQSGRALASLTGGSLTINEVLLQECWDDVGRTTFADTTPDLPGVPYEDGDISACEPRLVEFDLAPPSLDAPQTDPEIPGPHPDEAEEIIVSNP